MKYCQHCGGEIHEEAVICIHCGRVLQNSASQTTQSGGGSDTLVTIALVFMIINCVATPAIGLIYGLLMLLISVAAAETSAMLIAAILVMVFCCIPLAWTLPLTITVSRRKKNHEPIGMGIKICTLIFVSRIAGILLLCHNDEY